MIPQGEQEVDVAVEIYNDADQETDEKFNVIISPAGLPSDITPKMGGDLAEVTIINDDCKYLIIVHINFILKLLTHS